MSEAQTKAVEVAPKDDSAPIVVKDKTKAEQEAEDKEAKRVKKMAAVAPSTVEKIGNGKHDLPDPKKSPAKKATRKRAGKKAAETRKRTGNVTYLTPNPHLWDAAKELAGGNTKLLFVLSPNEIIVMNHPKQFTKRIKP